eukprot:TRINITY_DN11190_c0_g1_i1.p1 TRINITY_DN11190_c0_g1~~TRINITY_DN11190_c0_g1_i1.p1  ORF type:complete len:644 (+),score=124.39 TRINITY_DN11190_c0_g1_i1:81-2012(+)
MTSMEQHAEGLVPRHRTEPFQRGDFSLQKVRERRRCTDVLFVVLFIVAYAILGVVTYQSVQHGDAQLLEKFAYGTNWQGRRCGVDEDVKNFPLTYFTVPAGTSKELHDKRSLFIKALNPVCTSACPETGASGVVTAYTRDNQNVCDGESAAAGLCTWYGAESTRFANYCLDAYLLTDGAITSGASFAADLQASAGFVTVFALLAVFLGFLLLLIIKWCSGLFIWGCILSMLALLAGLGYFMHSDADKVAEHTGYDEDSIRTAALGVWAIDAVLALFVLCSCRTIGIAAATLTTAADFMLDVKASMVQPLVSAVGQLAVLVVFMSIITATASRSIVEATAHEGRRVCTFGDNQYLNPFCVDFTDTGSTTAAVIYIIFMYLWTAALIHAMSVFTMAYAAGIWYYSPYEASALGGTQKALPGGNTFCDCNLILSGMCASLKHLGSLIFGSLVLAICQLAVLLCKWAKKRPGGENAVTKTLNAISTCVASCLERCARLVTNGAYIQIALAGKPFCSACLSGLGVVVRNPTLFSVVSSCSVVFRVLGPLIVLGITGTAAWFTLAEVDMPAFLVSRPLASPNAPLAAVMMLAFIAGDIMMHPYSVVSTTVMHAFAADKEMEEHAGCGTGVRSLPHTPKPLMKFIDDHCS